MKPILIVEDETTVCDVLKDLLESEGYRVFTACDGKQGMEVLASMERPCVVLLDMMMPEMDGSAFLQAIREADLLLPVPVVVMTATLDRPEGAVGYLKKPFFLEQLLEVVRIHCG